MVRSWVTERNLGRSEDSRLWAQHRQSADAAIEQMIHAKNFQGLPVVPQLDGIDDEYDDVRVSLFLRESRRLGLSSQLCSRTKDTCSGND